MAHRIAPEAEAELDDIRPKPLGCSADFRGIGGKVSSLLAMQLALFPLQFGEELFTVHTLATL